MENKISRKYRTYMRKRAKKRAKKKKIREQVEELRRQTGWSKRKAKRALAYAKEHGIMRKTYLALGYWNIPQELLLDVHYNKAEKRKEIVEEIAKRNKLKRVDVERMMIEARYCDGVRYEYFRNYRWWELTDEQKETIFLRPHGRMLSRHFKKPDANGLILNEKEQFYEAFPDEIGRKWFLFDPETITFERYCDELSCFSTSNAIYKPHGLSGGKGIRRILLDAPLEEQFDQFVEKGLFALIEECVENHPDMASLCPDSVNTVRVVTLCWGGEYKPLYAGMRVGAGKGRPVDSVRRGGMSVGVDLATGKVCTGAARKSGKYYECHPVTKVPFKGFQIPCWDEILQLVDASAHKVLDIAGLGYVGWDIAVTPTGPIIIEANNWPSPSLAQLPHFLCDGTGLRPLVDEYLKDCEGTTAGIARL